MTTRQVLWVLGTPNAFAARLDRKLIFGVFRAQ